MASTTSKKSIRHPAVAGTFYPDTSEALAHQIDLFLEEAVITPPNGEPVALIVPHAGYIFSGWVAAYAYKTLLGKNYKTVILVGLCHRGLKGISVYDKGGFETPLGTVNIDEDIARKIIDYDPENIISYTDAHTLEHSLEVQIPFLQRTLTDFKIVPILIDETRLCSTLATAIVQAIKKQEEQTLLIGSTDLTHYPRYEDAKKVDKAAIDAIVSLDPEKLDKVTQYWMEKDIPNLHCVVCSEAAVKTVLMAAEKLGANHSTVLKSANSGDVPIGDKYQVVGYAAIDIFRGKDDDDPVPSYKEMENELGALAPEQVHLDNKNQKELLRIARETLIYCTEGKDISKITSQDPQLNIPMGAFVTLKKKGELRGCIGRFEPDSAVKDIVRDMTVAAALEDPRFEPVSPKELKDIQIEISVLTPREQIKNISAIQIGKHGLYIRKGWYAGTLLPQVATEYNWDVETFLQQTCMKAGLPPDAWKGKDTEIYIYSAIIFHE